MISYPKDLSSSESSIYLACYYQCNELLQSTSKTLKEVVDIVINRMGFLVSDQERLRIFLLKELAIQTEPISFITSAEVKESKWWSEGRLKNFSIEYWQRYNEYLISKDTWSLNTVKDIDDATTAVMNALSDPNVLQKQERVGLVFGHVQSGKTGHYIGLINKAIDAGYKLIIVFAGIHNNLRSQTQTRIEEEVLGYKTGIDVQGDFKDSKNAIGVGIGINNQITNHQILQSFTNRDEKGDFNNKVAGASLQPPFLIVTKKNATVLRRLIRYFNECPSAETDSRKKYIPSNIPALIIDDEADQASLNTKEFCYDDNGNIKADYDPTTINKLIRTLLSTFENRSYVGYTATPYANIFIPPHVDSEKYGVDLYPKDFIMRIPRSESYIGAREFFGLTGDDESIAMPLCRDIIVGASYLGKGTKPVDVVEELPRELKEAIKMFFITVAIRNLRGHKNKPNTMLVHIVRFVSQQNIIKKKIEKYMNEEIVNYVINKDVEIEANLRVLWENDIQLTSRKMREEFPKYMQGVEDSNWNEIYVEIQRVIIFKEYEIYSVNGKSDDSLIYERHKEKPFNVIVVGGDKLSRGLTLEGLTISYFTRSSNTYDTLMQMGRWFGYRPNYLDLCRLYTTKKLKINFFRISMATEDLVGQIDYMNAMKQTPITFGLRVESHPDMLISSKNKVRTGKEMKRDFSNHLSQTRIFDIDPNQFDTNFAAAENLLLNIGRNPISREEFKKIKNRDPAGKHMYWFNVSGFEIANFFEAYETTKTANRSNSKYMSDYVKNQMSHGGLTDWTVCLINVNDTIGTFDIAGHQVGIGIQRDTNFNCSNDEKTCDIHTLTSLGHEYLDYNLNDITIVEQMKGTRADVIRKETRNRKNGLLILYPLGVVEPLTKLEVKGEHKTPFGFASVFPDRKGHGDIKSYRVTDIAIERDNNEFSE